MQTKLKDICCKELLRLINDPELEINYTLKFRRFCLYDCIIDYCPMCGKRFPVELYDFMNYIQEKEYGINRENYSEFEEKKLIPKEFETDDWWLKREHYPDFPKKYQTRQELFKEIVDSFNLKSDTEKLYHYRKLIKKEKALEKKLGIFCCTSLWNDVYESESNPVPYTRTLTIYEPEKRVFRFKSVSLREIKIFPRRKRRFLFYQFYHCPRCGKKLPSSLSKDWFEIVTKDFGIKDIFNQKELQKKLPSKFLTEEWWRERGL